MAVEVCLLGRIGEKGSGCSVGEDLGLKGPDGGHVLDDHETYFVAGLLEDGCLDFDRGFLN